MKPGIRKTLRVATTFTGAAACAAAFTPAAMAGTAHQARLGGKTITLPGHRGIRHGIRPDNTGSIELTTSCGTVPHWVHLANAGSEICAGFKGTFSFYRSPQIVTKECGGTNHGYLESPGGTKWDFYSGTTFTTPPFSLVSEIHISGWKGNDACPTKP
jgi:hypothetical protein